jgi:hypothetical protein
LSKDGFLIVTPETELEAYAIKQWCAENLPEQPEPHVRMLISYGGPFKEPT